MRLINPSQKLTLEFLKFIAIHISRDKAISKDILFKHFDKTEAYMKNTLDFLIEHDIVEINNGNLFLQKKEAREFEKSESSRLNAYYNAIASSKPLIEFCYFLQEGHDKVESVKLVKLLYGIENSNSSLIKIFSEWMTIIDISIEKIKEDIPKHEIAAASANRLLAGTFIKDELGDYFKDIPQAIQDDLSKSITKVTSDPSDAINIAGRALEDFFRLVVGKDENLKKSSGIIQIVSVLNQEKNKYPSKLNNIAMSLGNMRSMGAAHGVDKQFNKSWSIEDHTAYSIIRLSLSTMKSYMIFQDTGELIF